MKSAKQDVARAKSKLEKLSFDVPRSTDEEKWNVVKKQLVKKTVKTSKALAKIAAANKAAANKAAAKKEKKKLSKEDKAMAALKKKMGKYKKGSKVCQKH